jgi:glycosyltransferase involved in cell wall biosynthesis
MANYNHGHYLTRALQSISEQSYRPLEIIVIDDGSTDNSVEVIQSFARNNPLIRLLRNERNMGVVYTANRLVEEAAGDYFLGTAADDEVLPGMFEKSMRLLAQYPEAGLCSTMSKVIDVSTGKETAMLPLKNISERECYISPETALQWMRRRESWIMGNTCVYRRSALVAAGGFIPELYAFCDGFIQMVLALKHGACFIPEPLAVWRFATTGYAAGAESNLETSLKMWPHAAHLMRTTYADLFPADYVDKWEREHLFRARLSALNRVHKEQVAVVSGFQESQSLLDRTFGTLVRGVMRLQFLFLLGLLLLRFGRWILPVLTRGLRVAARSVSERRSKDISRNPAQVEFEKFG